MSFIYQSKSIQAPALIGKSIQEALRIAAKQGLSLRLVHEQDDSELPVGTVLSQNPLPNTHIKAHQSIHCIISKKTESLAPQLIGKNLDAIRKNLEERGISYKIYYLSSTSPYDICLAQDPSPGVPMSSKRMILYVSQGNTQQFLFPDFRQKSVDEVQACLAAAPVVLQVSHVVEQPEDHSCSQCIVSDQRPRPGTVVQLDKQKPIHVQLIATPVVDSSSNEPELPTV